MGIKVQSKTMNNINKEVTKNNPRKITAPFVCHVLLQKDGFLEFLLSMSGPCQTTWLEEDVAIPLPLNLGKLVT